MKTATSPDATCKFSRRPASRRGVILLVVMGLLVLLTMVAVTYVVATREFKTAARAATAGERYDDGFEELLERAFKQLIRGSHNPYSAARYVNLLEDAFGNDYVEVQVQGGGASWFPSNNAGEQVFLSLNVNHIGGSQLSGRSGYYNGRVVTFTTGPARNISGRITGFLAGGGSSGTIWMLPLSTPTGFAGVPLGSLDGSKMIINGRPFNGSGSGLNTTTLTTTAVKQGGSGNVDRVALLPNVGYGNSTDDPTLGGADEDYDIPDYNNPHLAARVWNTSTNRWEVQSPSFYDAALANWHRANNTNIGDPRVRRSIVFRPLEDFHPDFTGSNPNHSALSNLNVGSSGSAPNPTLWDVDNDGDGIPDSVWIDLGMPVQTAADGRQYKPLFAVMIVDMDNRLNLNVHGQPNQLNRPYFTPDSVTNDLLAGGTRSVTAQLPYGDGRGPAEVNPCSLLDASFPDTFKQLMYGLNRTGNQPRVMGRYGEAELYFGGTNPKPGVTDGQRDRKDVVKNFNLPSSQSALAWSDWDGDAILALDKHGAPIRDRSTFMELAGGTMQYELEHAWHFNPYSATMNTATGRSTIDAPFTMAQMERFLRPFDVDSQSLPHRLQYLIGGAYTWKLGGQITAESYSIPTPAIRPSAEIRGEINAQGLPGNDARRRGMLDFIDFVELKLLADAREGGYTAPNINQAIASLVPVDLANGLRWNINHPFGNYQDDNNDNDGIFANPGSTVDRIDEIGESRTSGGERVYRQVHGMDTALPAPWNAAVMDYGNDGQTDEFKRRHPRQLYARYLYCLMMMLKDHDYHFPNGEGLTGVAAERYTAQRIAQWAVNVVDFMDDDHAMTYFEFDYEPFKDNTGGGGDPWNVDGYLGVDPSGNASADDTATYRGVVWGVERPDLLLTETFATHEFRTEDTSEGGMLLPGDGLTPYGLMTDDDDLDQRRKPQGSLFLELYNPWHDREYNLSALAPASTDGYRRPHFQLVIAPILNGTVPANPDTGHINPTFPSMAEAERIVWFTNKAIYPGSVDPTAVISPKIYYSDLEDSGSAATIDYYNKVNYGNGTAASMFRIGRGEYAVIGPRVTTRFGNSGPGTNPAENLITIQLLDQAAPQAPYTNGGGAYTAFGVVDQLVSNTGRIGYPNWQGGNQRIKAPQGIVINYPHPLSVSEPGPGQTYYPPATGTTADADFGTYTYQDTYAPPIDTPLDDIAVRTQGTREAFRYVYLQRLADPDRAWNNDTNPYITVDFAPIDLNVYNGIYTGPDTENPDPNNKPVGAADTWTYVPNAEEPLKFRTRERNGAGHNIWQQSFAGINPDRSVHNFRHSLGYLNGLIEGIGSGEDQEIFATNGIWDEDDGVAPAYYGEPRPPAFPWMHIKNAPLVSPMELMQVPASSPSRLLYEFAVRRSPFTNHYQERLNDNSDGPPFGHLLNFFNSTQATSGTDRSNFQRLFEFIHVPSKFAGTEMVLDPALFAGGGGSHHYHPPFNRVSMFRDPGRVNVNTLFDDGGVWNAIFDQSLSGGGNTHWQRVWESRQGYGTGGVGSLRLNDNSPTFFANPFRQYASDYDVPIDALKRIDLTGAHRQYVDSTLLRPDPQNTSKPLLAARAADETSAAPFGYATVDYVDGNRSAYFRYQPLNQASNTLTTTSNVYAIWVTVGFFEATPVPRTNDHPDGYTYGRELGADTGDIVRHRGFYIYDRSIPVGFIRGEDLNTEQGVLVRRIIE